VAADMVHAPYAQLTPPALSVIASRGGYRCSPWCARRRARHAL